MNDWQFREIMERERQEAMMQDVLRRQQGEMMRQMMIQPMQFGADWVKAPAPKKGNRNNEILLLTEI